MKFLGGLDIDGGNIAMVNQIRHRNFHENAIFYSVATDGYTLTFLRVDNERRVRPLLNL